MKQPLWRNRFSDPSSHFNSDRPKQSQPVCEILNWVLMSVLTSSFIRLSVRLTADFDKDPLSTTRTVWPVGLLLSTYMCTSLGWWLLTAADHRRLLSIGEIEPPQLTLWIRRCCANTPVLCAVVVLSVADHQWAVVESVSLIFAIALNRPEMGEVATLRNNNASD